MTAAFNLSQLANNLNTSGQLDATDGLSGLVANANLASSGTASSSTYLRGDRTWSELTIPPSVIVAYRVSVSTTPESRNGAQTASFLNSTSSYVSGLTAITHTCASASNYIILRFSACFRGNATSDAVQMLMFADGSVLGGGAWGHMNNSTGSGAKEMGMTANAIGYPNDTSSHSYMVGWAATENGASTYINSTDDPGYGTQCIFELFEVSPAGVSGSVYAI